jgi:tetratricopeptide (TPR) repeat protein
LNPADAYLTHQITNIYLKRKDLENAIFHIQNGFVYDTNNLELLKLRGYVWLLSGRYDRAIWDLERAFEIDSTSLFTNKYLGLSYHEEKLFGPSREALYRAWQLDSTDAETAYFLGSACRWSRFEEDGVRFYRKSIELQQPDPKEIKNVYLQLAELYKVLHRFDEALEAYREALMNDPADNVIYFKIAQMYDRNLDQKKTAIIYYEKYLDGEVTDHQLFDSSDGNSQALRPYVEKRIQDLREDLFFENQIP